MAPSGGKLPDPMRAFVLEAIGKGMDIESGLHQFLCDDEEFAAAARASVICGDRSGRSAKCQWQHASRGHPAAVATCQKLSATE